MGTLRNEPGNVVAEAFEQLAVILRLLRRYDSLGGAAALAPASTSPAA